MSRNQFKRQRKLEAAKEKWKLKAAEKKEKLRALRQKAAADASSLSEAEAAKLAAHVQSRQRKKDKKRLDVQPEADAPTIVIDMSFDDKMVAREQASLYVQLRECHAMNRCARPVHLVFAGVSDAAETTLQAYDAQSWKNARIEKQHYLRAFEPARVVYLSSEAERTIDDLEPGRVYIIGGLVDHNREKGLTHRLATEAAVETVRLPIDELVQMDTRKVLAVNHVFQIMLARYHGMSWQQAFLSAIPQRKGISLPLIEQSSSDQSSIDQSLSSIDQSLSSIDQSSSSSIDQSSSSSIDQSSSSSSDQSSSSSSDQSSSSSSDQSLSSSSSDQSSSSSIDQSSSSSSDQSSSSSSDQSSSSSSDQSLSSSSSDQSSSSSIDQSSSSSSDQSSSSSSDQSSSSSSDQSST